LIDPTAVAVVNAANDTIAVGSTVFTVGQRVRYAVGGSDPDTMPIDELRPIGGLVDGETYVVAAYDSVDRTIQLSQPVKAGDPRPRRRANLLHHPHQRPHDPAQRKHARTRSRRLRLRSPSPVQRLAITRFKPKWPRGSKSQPN